MATLGPIFPGSAEMVSELPYDDETIANPANVTADDSSFATITGNAFDSPDQTFVLKAYNFNFSSIPDGSTIDGVTANIRTWYSNATVSIHLAQLLDTSRANGGTNQFATPTALTSSEATYTKGGATDKWGLALTTAWVKDPDFGIGIAFQATGTNSRLNVDWITLTIDYTMPSITGTLASTLGAVTCVGTAIEPQKYSLRHFHKPTRFQSLNMLLRR